MKSGCWKIPLLALTALGLVVYVTCQVKRRLAMVPLKDAELVNQAVGSFLIGLPKGAKIEAWNQQGYKPGYNQILAIPGITPSEFEAGVKKRIKELKEAPHAEGGSMLIREVPLGVPNSKMLMFWEDATVKDKVAKAEAYSYKSGCLFQINTEFLMDLTHQERTIREFESICRSLRQRRPDEIPAEPGICYENAFLANDPTIDKDYMERIMVDISWKQRPDIQISLSIFSNKDMLDPPLLKRVTPDKVGCMRARDRNVGLLEGQELLERVTEADGRLGHVFTWDSRGKPHSWDCPSMQLSMMTGSNDHSSSLSDHDALKLWDAILDSIRLRPTKSETPGTSISPNDPASSPGSAPIVPLKPKAALGVRVQDGQRCPQSGIWECDQANNLAGHWKSFREGEELPSALLPGQTGLLARIKGTHDDKVVPTTWTLVRYPEQDG